MIRLRSNNRDLTHWIVMLAVGAAVYLLGIHFAHAAGPAEATTPPPGVDWNFWLAAGAAVLGALSVVLHVVAPRTKTTVDDALRDDIDAVLKWFKFGIGAAPAAPPPPTLTVAPAPRDKQAGYTRLGVMVSLAGGALIGLVFWACTKDQVKAGATAGAVAFLDCEAAHLDQQAIADVKALASAEIRHLIEGGAAPSTDALKADLAPIVSDLGRCGWAAAVAAYGAVVAPASGTAVRALVAGPDPAQVRAAFATAARQLGWQPVRLAGGDVL